MKIRFHWAPGFAGLLVSLCAINAPLQAAGAVRALDGMPYAGLRSKVAAALKLSPDAPARTITLPAVSDAEWAAATGAGAARAKYRPLAIGFARAVPADSGLIPLSTLDWQATGNGYRAAHVQLASPGAGGIRVELSVQGPSAGLLFRFAETGAGSPRVYGPYSAAELEAAGHWSPALAGDAGLIEIVAGPEAALGAAALVIASIAHLDRGPSGEVVKTYPGSAGPAGACNIDIACIDNPSQALLQAVSAVAHVSFMQQGVAYLCTGTLLNSVDANGQPTQAPYFVTANHCVSDQASAGTMVLSWFFQRSTCADGAPATYQQTAGGATLLHTSEASDVTLVRLAEPPPAGAYMAGWDASPLFPQDAVVSIHHPEGNPKKYSAGVTNSYKPDIFIPDDAGKPTETWPDGTPLLRSLVEVHWTQGTTEGGSSGGGLFTRAANGEYRLRGTLWGGGASCSYPDEYDYFGRFDLSFPYMAQYLAGGSLLPAGNNAVEFYNVSLDHYFTTAYQAEVDSVEQGGAGPGWMRTGYGFAVGPTASGPNSDVCRFYGNRANGGPNSHFYTPIPAECAAVKLDPGWTFESPDVYTMPSVDAQNNCPSGTTPVLRVYNNGFVPGQPSNSNHRYSVSPTVYALMQALGWRAEGTVMCSRQQPAAGAAGP